MLASRPVRRATTLLCALALAAPAGGGAAGEWDLRVELGGGLDTNPERLAGPGAEAEGFATALARARGALEGERLRLSGDLSLGGRLYPGRPGATAGASRLDGAARLALGDGLAAAAAIAASTLAERGHRLDHQALRGEGALRWERGEWGTSLSGGWTLFAPGDPVLRRFQASGPEGWLRASFTPATAHALSAGLGLWRAAYPRWDVPAEERRDLSWTAAAEYGYRGAVLATLGYAWTSNRSSAAGGDFERHRVTARGAAFLPLDLSLALRVSLQWSRYPEPLYLPQQLLLAEGQESQNAFEARLVRPLGESWELALAFAHYRSEVARGGAAPDFARSVASLTVGWRRRSERPRQRARARRRLEDSSGALRAPA